MTGDTRGGPPTYFSWAKDGRQLINSSTFRISIGVNLTEPLHSRYTHGVYASTLTVIGRQPGTYSYTVGNRLTTPVLRSSIHIVGMQFGK